MPRRARPVAIPGRTYFNADRRRMPQAPEPPLAYRPEIDGLRAVAVLVVVLFHAGFGIPGGYVGVDVFFVISGFLITSLLRRELVAGTFSLAGFYERRARRILPASLVMTLAVLAAGYWRLLPSDFENLGRSAAYHGLFAANVYFYRQAIGYFGTAAAGMPLLHTWSLGVEEQFYFAFPLVLLACHRLGRRRFHWPTLATLLALLVGGLAWAIYSVPWYPAAGFFLLPARAWELMAGAALAVLPACRASRAVRETVSVAALAAVLLPALLYGDETLFPGLAAVPPCVGAAGLIWSCRGRGADDAGGPPFSQTLVGRLLAVRPVVFVGTISYSLYLWHWPVLVLGNYWRLTPAPPSVRLAEVALAGVLAVLSWRFVETPVRRRAWLAGRRSLLAGVTAATVAVLLAAVVVVRTGGVPRRFDAKVDRIDAVRRERLKLLQLRPADVARNRLPVIGRTDAGPVDLFVWGDSHADAALPAFDAYCVSHGLRGRAATHSSMTPLLDYATDSAKAFRPTTIRYNRAVVDYVKRHHVPTVVLVNYWHRDIDADPAALDAALGRTIAALRAAGATTYVMLQVPGYAVPVPKALACEAVFGRAVPGWRQTPADYRREQGVMLDLAKKYESPDCHFIDTASAFAAGDDRPFVVAGKGRPLYLDNHHLTNRAAKDFLAPLLDRTLPSIANAGSPSP